jgi:uncharacterized protein YqhQ
MYVEKYGILAIINKTFLSNVYETFFALYIILRYVFILLKVPNRKTGLAAS